MSVSAWLATAWVRRKRGSLLAPSQARPRKRSDPTRRGASAALAPRLCSVFRSLSRRNILIHAKHIRRIVLPLDPGELCELLRAERGTHAFRGFARPDVIHV